ncbi:hypothetical protein ACVWZW_007003 [Bradyrhizobium sp. F1.13.4]
MPAHPSAGRQVRWFCFVTLTEVVKGKNAGRDDRSRGPEFQSVARAVTRRIIRATADGIGAMIGTVNIG